MRISWPTHIAASVVHDLIGLPSISTTHAPQLDVSHPQCVPVKPGVSRMKCTSSVRGSTSRETSCPLIVIFTSMSMILLARRGVHLSSCCRARAVARRSARTVRTLARWRL